MHLLRYLTLRPVDITYMMKAHRLIVEKQLLQKHDTHVQYALNIKLCLWGLPHGKLQCARSSLRSLFVFKFSLYRDQIRVAMDLGSTTETTAA